jgi:hypothetical protein
MRTLLRSLPSQMTVPAGGHVRPAFLKSDRALEGVVPPCISSTIPKQVTL